MKNQNHFPKVPNLDTGTQMTSLLSQLNSKASILTGKAQVLPENTDVMMLCTFLHARTLALWSCSTPASLHLNSLSEVSACFDREISETSRQYHSPPLKHEHLALPAHLNLSSVSHFKSLMRPLIPQFKLGITAQKSNSKSLQRLFCMNTVMVTETGRVPASEAISVFKSD